MVESVFKWPTFSYYTNFPLGFCILHFLNIHCWLKIANITPHGPDDGSVELKRYSVDLSINLSFYLDRCYQFFYILSDYNPLFTFHIKYIWFLNIFCRYTQLNDQTVLFLTIQFSISQ